MAMQKTTTSREGKITSPCTSTLEGNGVQRTTTQANESASPLTLTQRRRELPSSSSILTKKKNLRNNEKAKRVRWSLPSSVDRWASLRDDPSVTIWCLEQTRMRTRMHGERQSNSCRNAIQPTRKWRLPTFTFRSSLHTLGSKKSKHVE